MILVKKQIVLSTHEEEISKYIRYKFSKIWFKKTKRINVKKISFINDYLVKPCLYLSFYY